MHNVPWSFFNKNIRAILYWVLFWCVQSLLMSGGKHLEFYLLKNIAIVGLQAIVVYSNLKLLYPLLFAKKRYIWYAIACLLLVYIVFSFSFFFIKIVVGLFGDLRVRGGNIVFSQDFWRVLSGSSFYSLALVCSTVYQLVLTKQRLEQENQEGKSDNEEEKLYIKDGGTAHIINPKDVLFIKGLREYVVWNTEKEKIVSLERLKNIEEQLKEKGFRRVHKSYIINTHKIRSLSSHTIKIGQEEIPIGRKYRDNIIGLYRTKDSV